MEKYEDAIKSGKTERLANWRWEDVRERIIQRDGSRCVKCKSRVGLQVDHIVPVGLGGSADDEENLQTLCEKCHRKKTLNDVERMRRVKVARKLDQRRENGSGGFL